MSEKMQPDGVDVADTIIAMECSAISDDCENTRIPSVGHCASGTCDIWWFNLQF